MDDFDFVCLINALILPYDYPTSSSSRVRKGLSSFDYYGEG
jgi:hypothetical protein